MHWKSHIPDEFSGNRRFNLELFKQVVRYLVQFANSPLFLNKALFYADFKHFKEYKTGIMGHDMSFGIWPLSRPISEPIQFTYYKRDYYTKGHHQLVSQEKPDLSVFDDAEKETLECIAELIRKDKGLKLLKLSHEEKGYKNTKSFNHISYQFAEDLQI